MIKMPPNKVLVRRLGLQDSFEGIQASDHEDREHWMLSNIGVVEAVCDSLHFTRDEVMWLKHIGRPAREIAETTRASCLFNAHIEAKVGDLVIYRRVNNVNADEVFEKDRLVIPHDDLIARVNPDGSLYPLCGNVIIEDRQEPITKVIAAGKPLLGYFDFVGYTDPDIDLVGKTVALNHRQSAPVSDNVFSDFKLLAYIKRRHILLIVE